MRLKLIAVILAWSLLLSACGLGADEIPTPLPSETPTPAPTLTPTPTIPLVILVLPADMDQDTSNLYQKTVYDLAQQAGYRFQVRNTLSPADLEPALKIVIALPPDPGIAALAAAAPQTQFLAINIPEVTAGGNISVLGSDVRQDLTAFLFGYIGAMVTDDHRIGMILPQGNPEAQKALTAFTNGMTYFCGLCRPFYYLPYEFPQSIEIPADESPSRYNPYADYLVLQRNVEFLYVYPDVATPDLLNYIGTIGVMGIGVNSPEPRPIYWVASMQPDVVKGIQMAWPDLLAGAGGKVIQAPLGLADVDPTLLTPGKQLDVVEVLADLTAGRIDTGVAP